MRWRLRVMQEQCWDTIDRKLGKLGQNSNRKSLYSKHEAMSNIYNFL